MKTNAFIGLALTVGLFLAPVLIANPSGLAQRPVNGDNGGGGALSGGLCELQRYTGLQHVFEHGGSDEHESSGTVRRLDRTDFDLISWKATMMMRMKLILVLVLLTLPMLGRAQAAAPQGEVPKLPPGAAAVVHLWPNGAPGFEDRKDIPEQAASYWVKTVNNPSITVFLPPKEKATGAAVILCPGGGFSELGFVPEGINAAQYFTSIGVAAFALKYRLPREPGSVYNMTHPRQDGLRAMRLVRSRAAEWGVDPKRIGMVGFSAGGEVVSMTAFSENAGDASATDPIDKISARPDFIVEIYPGGAGIPQMLPPDAPTAFLLVADDDDHTDSVLRIFRLYRAAKLPVEVHVFTKGQHAFNMGTRSKLTTIKSWPQRLADWMGDNNILDPAVPGKNVR